MNSRILVTGVSVVTTLLSFAGPVYAQSAAPTKLEGLVHDYTAALDASGPWQLVGEWSATLKGASGRVDLIASLSMVRSEAAARSAHTHHVGLQNVIATPIAGGYRISGPATITSNGAAAAFSGSTVVIDITGSAVVPLAKIAITFQGDAAGHFGDQPIEGVVRAK
jgi:hypothetical protein